MYLPTLPRPKCGSGLFCYFAAKFEYVPSLLQKRTHKGLILKMNLQVGLLSLRKKAKSTSAALQNRLAPREPIRSQEIGT